MATACTSSLVISSLILVLLTQSASVHSGIGHVSILNELPTEVRFVLFSNSTGCHRTQYKTDGMRAEFDFDTSLAPVYDVAITAAHETPIKTKTIRVWKRGFGYPNDAYPVSNWIAASQGLLYLKPSKGWVLVGGWDM